LNLYKFDFPEPRKGPPKKTGSAHLSFTSRFQSPFEYVKRSRTHLCSVGGLLIMVLGSSALEFNFKPERFARTLRFLCRGCAQFHVGVRQGFLWNPVCRVFGFKGFLAVKRTFASGKNRGEKKSKKKTRRGPKQKGGT